MQVKSIYDLLKHEGMFLAGIPFVGTLVGFVFEAGYASYYDIPINLIRIDFNRIVTSTAIVAMTYLFFHICLIWITFLTLRNNALVRAFFKPTFTALIFAALLYGFSDMPNGWMIPAGVFVSLLLLNLLPPIFSTNNEEDYMARLSSHVKTMESTSVSNEIDASTIMSLVFFGSILVFGVGRSFALDKSSYWVPSQFPNMIVVAFYGDTAVLKEFDVKSKKLLSRMTLVDAKSETGNLYNKVDTGILGRYTK